MAAPGKETADQIEAAQNSRTSFTSFFQCCTERLSPELTILAKCEAQNAPAGKGYTMKALSYAAAATLALGLVWNFKDLRRYIKIEIM